MIGRTTLIYEKNKHEKMTKNKEDDNVSSLEDNEWSLEFIFDRSIRMG